MQKTRDTITNEGKKAVGPKNFRISSQAALEGIGPFETTMLQKE